MEAEHGIGSRYISGGASQTVGTTADVNDLASVIPECNMIKEL